MSRLLSQKMRSLSTHPLLSVYISKKVNKIKSFKIVRYVDDMYILFSADIDKNEVHKVYSQIRNEYSSILKKYSLALNGKKCCVKKIEEINDELKKSLYDEIVKGVKHEIEELFDNNTLYYFVIELLDKIKTEFVDIEVYSSKIKLFINMKIGSLNDPMNISRDMSKTGHHGNGDYVVEISNEDDIENVIPLIKQSLKVNKK